MSEKAEILSVSEDRWSRAQDFEGNLWIKSNQKNSYLKILLKFASAVRKPVILFNYLRYCDFYCGDDWNYW